MKLQIAILCFLVLLIHSSIAGKQCITVTGRLRCSSEVPVFAQLVDRDRFTRNDIMAELCPQNRQSESFRLQGCASDFMNRIDPEVHIYHKCKGGDTIKKVRLIIPKTSLGRAYNFEQVIDLDGTFPDEKNVKKFPTPKMCAGVPPS